MPGKKRKERVDLLALFEHQTELALEQPEPDRAETQEEIWERLALLKEKFTPDRLKRVEGYRRKRVATQHVMLTLPAEMHHRMSLIAKLRDIPMSHLIEVIASPTVDELYADLRKDFADRV